jgi:cell division protein FtsB
MIIVDDRKELLESSLKRLERIRELEKENDKLKKENKELKEENKNLLYEIKC